MYISLPRSHSLVDHCKVRTLAVMFECLADQRDCAHQPWPCSVHAISHTAESHSQLLLHAALNVILTCLLLCISVWPVSLSLCFSALGHLAVGQAGWFGCVLEQFQWEMSCIEGQQPNKQVTLCMYVHAHYTLLLCCWPLADATLSHL